MLNISNNPINKKVTIEGYRSFKIAFNKNHYNYFNRFVGIFFIIALLVMFLPWTQNVTSKGYVTTLTPDQRPQTIQSPIPGKIEKWYVREGDFVTKGDTILFISEIKTEYQDPKLIERTNLQRDAKSNSVVSYKEKVKALEKQISALGKEMKLKLSQAKNKISQAYLKIESDSIDLEAVKIKYQIAKNQYDRVLTLQNEGLKSKTQVEEKLLKVQESQAKLVSQENKLMESKNELINAKIEVGRIEASYADKIAKAKSDKFAAQSSQYEVEAQTAKLESESEKYRNRNTMYYITAPQDGFINKALRVGIGETFKDGEPLVGIMPANYELAVETFVDPIDYPLIHKGEKVRIQFDGWPAIFFSGWPNFAYGTFGGEIVAVETFISDNGKFRVLVAPDKQENKWPEGVRVGSGAQTMALLDDVPIWFEIWRKLNQFPPNYYTPNKKNSEKL